MNRVLIDTNIILDLLAKRVPLHIESEQLFSLADLGKTKLIVSTLSIVNAHYILNDILKQKSARSIVGKFKVLVQPFELTDKILELALNDNQFKDFEDAIQFYTALESQSEIIVTRNLKDFKQSSIPVMSPKEYLTKIKTDR